MTPNEKAKELFIKYYTFDINNTPNKSFSWYECKKCTLICVDEIINSSPSAPIISDKGTFVDDILESTKWWNQVKQEIEKL